MNITQAQLEKRLFAFSKTLFSLIKGMIINILKFLPVDLIETTQDISQTALTATWIWIQKGIFAENPPNVEGYARKVAEYKVIDEVKRRGKWKQVELENISENISPDYEQNLDIAKMLRLLPSLPPTCEVMLRAQYLEGKTLKELAEAGIITEQQARRGNARCLEELKKKMLSTY